MENSTITKLKGVLEKEKAALEEQLKSFARKDEKLKGDYDAEFPNLGVAQSTDELAQEVSLYEERLPIEYALELKLQDINAALEKIAKGTYGICEECGKEIDIRRLETKPEAKYCIECKKKLDQS